MFMFSYLRCNITSLHFVHLWVYGLIPVSILLLFCSEPLLNPAIDCLGQRISPSYNLYRQDNTLVPYRVCEPALLFFRSPKTTVHGYLAWPPGSTLMHLCLSVIQFSSYLSTNVCYTAHSQRIMACAYWFWPNP